MLLGASGSPSWFYCHWRISELWAALNGCHYWKICRYISYPSVSLLSQFFPGLTVLVMLTLKQEGWRSDTSKLQETTGQSVHLKKYRNAEGGRCDCEILSLAEAAVCFHTWDNLHQFGVGKEGKIRKKTTKQTQEGQQHKETQERKGEFIYDLSLTRRHGAHPGVRPKCPSRYFGVAVLHKEEGQAPGADTTTPPPQSVGPVPGEPQQGLPPSPEQHTALQPIRHHRHRICQNKTSEAPCLTY